MGAAALLREEIHFLSADFACAAPQQTPAGHSVPRGPPRLHLGWGRRRTLRSRPWPGRMLQAREIYQFATAAPSPLPTAMPPPPAGQQVRRCISPSSTFACAPAARHRSKHCRHYWHTPCWASKGRAQVPPVPTRRPARGAARGGKGPINQAAIASMSLGVTRQLDCPGRGSHLHDAVKRTGQHGRRSRRRRSGPRAGGAGRRRSQPASQAQRT